MTDDDGDLALLGDMLDHSFDAGPGGMATPADRLAEGRRALRRRRRIGLVASSLGVVAAVGVGVALSGTGAVRGTDGPRPPVATKVPTATPSTVSPSPSAPSTPTAAKLRKAEKDAQRYLTESIPASYDGFGRPVV